jgi:hypothetical protein
MLGDSDRSASSAQDKHRKDVHDFWWHAFFYVIANGIMITQDLIAGGGLEWSYWTFIPWGIGLAIHGMVVLFTRPRRTVGTA